MKKKLLTLLLTGAIAVSNSSAILAGQQVEDLANQNLNISMSIATPYMSNEEVFEELGGIYEYMNICR